MHDEHLFPQVDYVSLSTVVVTFRFQVLRFQVGEHLLSKVLPSPHETFLAGGMEHLEPFFACVQERSHGPWSYVMMKQMAGGSVVGFCG